TLLCLFFWLWKSGRARGSGLAGMGASVLMVLTSASSTPLMAFPAGLMALCLWPARSFMRYFRWGIVLFLVGLQIFMKAPVWMAINHVDLVGGNSSYHRAMLVDAFVRHFWDWWLIGVKSTHSWGWDMWDQANQFVAEGETGGLATFICFVLLVTRCFAAVGT